jgi:putative ABC transport system substrate-binding protein
MMRRFLGLLLTIFLLVASSTAEGQQAAKIPRIGILQGGSAASSRNNLDAFRAGLHDLGYVREKNIALEYRYADGKLDRLPVLASELVRMNVDILVVGGTQTTTAAKQATSTIPIVVGGAGDLVAAGLVASLARPGGNVTGSTRMSKDLRGKRLELFKETVSKVARVAVLSFSATALLDRDELKEIESVARHLGVTVKSVEISDPNELQTAYKAMIKEHADAVMILQGSFSSLHRRQLIELAAKNRLPSMCEESLFVNDGCLMSYGPDLPHLYRRAAIFVDKILKGAKPADLPVEQPTKFEFVINLKAAKHIGLTIPPNVLARADRVIR